MAQPNEPLSMATLPLADRFVPGASVSIVAFRFGEAMRGGSDRKRWLSAADSTARALPSRKMGHTRRRTVVAEMGIMMRIP